MRLDPSMALWQSLSAARPPTMDIDPQHLTKNAPGAIGALLALRFMRGPSWLHSAIGFVGGCACSIYGTEFAVKWTGSDPGLAGFVLGLFGMAVVSKIHEAIDTFKPAETIGNLLKKWGL